MILFLAIFKILLGLAHCSPTQLNSELNWKIIGGSDAPDNVYTYQISIQENGDHKCGGSIVHPEWVVTAAHCIYKRPRKRRVVAGISRLSEKGYSYAVLESYAHPEFNRTLIINDVAILKVEPITFNDKVSMIKVETKHCIKDDTPVILTGWGALLADDPCTEHLQVIHLETTTVEFCDLNHRLKIYETQICTYTKIAEGSCHGDSGGPLVQRKRNELFLTGIVSYGKPCAMGIPDVYARVSSYVKWFNEQCNNCLKK